MTDTLLFRADCPRCGKLHDVRVETHARQPSRDHWIRPGSDFKLLPHPESAGYVRVREAGHAEDVRILEDGITCGDEPLWTVMTIRSERLEHAELVALDLQVLGTLHWLTPSRHGFWQWANQLQEPGAWAERLYTSDPVRRLRQQLLLRAPLLARNRLEATLFISMLNCVPVGAMTAAQRDGRLVWMQPCAFEPTGEVADFELTFELVDAGEKIGVVELPGGPSAILSPEVFRENAVELAAEVPAYPEDVGADAMPEAHSQIVADLGQALVYIDQLIAFIPEGATSVPIDAIWGDAVRVELEERPERYERDYLLAMRVAFRRQLERVGTRHVIEARSALEMAMFMDLHRCPRCATPTPQLPSRIEAQADTLHVVYAGACTGCKLYREFRFHMVSDEEPIEAASEELTFGVGTSTCLDPAQWLVVASQRALQSGESDRYQMRLAIGALEQALSFFPPGEEFLRPDAITSLLGWLVFDTEPERLSRSSMERERERLRTALQSSRD